MATVLVPVKFGSDQKYVRLVEIEGHYDFRQFCKKVIERFCLPPEANIKFKDATGTEVDGEIFSDLLHLGNTVLTLFSDDVFGLLFSSTSDVSDVGWSSGSSTVIVDGPPDKQPRVDYTSSVDTASAKQLIETVMRNSSGGEEVLEEYQRTETLTDATRRKMVNILVSHMMENHGHLPSKATREKYALGVVMAFPSLKDPFAKKGYEHFYDATSGTGYISWRLKTVQRRRRQIASKPQSSPSDLTLGGPTSPRTVKAVQQLDGDACQEALSLLNHTTDRVLIMQKMRETFQFRQKIVNDPDKSGDVLTIFPRFLDTAGLVNQDFQIMFDEETSARLLQKWDLFFKPGIIRQAMQLVPTPELQCLIKSAQSPAGNDLEEEKAYDHDMASLLLLIHLLPPPPGGSKNPKISATDAMERLITFHKSCCSLEERLRNNKKDHPYILAVGRQKNKIDKFYIVMDCHLIPLCGAVQQAELATSCQNQEQGKM
ncbi:hypothetical protein WMY93_002310 [Mugilogobius chulae]|uniref:Uncharacterized protein n=1 Tax=Mugilogobius chulae TaxID=88201 RepID=A0AAW0Q4E6_9GOBI